MVLKQRFIVNSDLGMGKGKIAGQVAHGAVFYTQIAIEYSSANIERYNRFLNWRYEDKELMTKVILKASQEEIIRLRCVLTDMNIWSHLVYDRGITQIPENSLTCMVIEPLEEEKCDDLFRHLKLL